MTMGNTTKKKMYINLVYCFHLTKVEIQIRTIAMDFWASLEHQLRYKQDVEFSEEMAAELYECAVLSAQLDNRMDALRSSVHGSKESRNA